MRTFQLVNIFKTFFPSLGYHYIGLIYVFILSMVLVVLNMSWWLPSLNLDIVRLIYYIR